jgi:hypothetical protein
MQMTIIPFPKKLERIARIELDGEIICNLNFPACWFSEELAVVKLQDGDFPACETDRQRCPTKRGNTIRLDNGGRSESPLEVV